jgi:hypothetical protein
MSQSMNRRQAMLAGGCRSPKNCAQPSLGHMRVTGNAVQQYARGGAVKSLKSAAQKLRHMGREGDTDLVHVNAREKQMLKASGGRGSINPRTGLREYVKTSKKNVKHLLRLFKEDAFRDQGIENKKDILESLANKKKRYLSIEKKNDRKKIAKFLGKRFATNPEQLRLDSYEKAKNMDPDIRGFEREIAKEAAIKSHLWENFTDKARRDHLMYLPTDDENGESVKTRAEELGKSNLAQKGNNKTGIIGLNRAGLSAYQRHLKREKSNIEAGKIISFDIPYKKYEKKGTPIKTQTRTLNTGITQYENKGPDKLKQISFSNKNHVQSAPLDKLNHFEGIQPSGTEIQKKGSIKL